MISRTAFENILKEYDAKQLASQRDLQERREMIDRQVPRLKEIDKEIAALSVEKAIRRIRGGSLDSYYEKMDGLKEEKASLLALSGFSLEDLEPRYECSKCKDTGYIGNELCSCFKSRITDVLYDQSNIKEILKDENFNTFFFKYYPTGPALENAEKAVEAAKAFVRDFDKGPSNLFISGNTGVGKTFLTNCIAKDLIDKGYFVVYLSAIRLFDILSDAAFGSGKAETDSVSADYMKKIIYNSDLLVIDDLGTEMVNSFTSTQLFNCVNERLLKDKHTIISTNFSLKQLQENYSERLVSRIVSRYTLIRLLGDDIRMKKKLEA
ncbi:MAG: ATP-binding protein [Lachnospiraceae bacterium]|nr:ATP-binding protein [Lachnospiraceae bacterium]